MEIKEDKYLAFFNAEIKNNSKDSNNSKENFKSEHTKHWYEGLGTIKDLETNTEYLFNFKTSEIYKETLEEKIIPKKNVKIPRNKESKLKKMILKNIYNLAKNQNEHIPTINFPIKEITEEELASNGIIPYKNGQLSIYYN